METKREKFQTVFVTHKEMLKHEPGSLHPESPARLSSILELLKDSKIYSKLKYIEPHKASLEEIGLVHPTSYIEMVRDTSLREGYLDADTSLSSYSFEAALLAAGSVLAAIEKVNLGEIRNAFCAVRPPGHHATINQGMGFCLFNNVAIGARYLQKRLKISPVLIFDFDAHHGNGTQDIFYEDSSCLYVSFHQSFLYPGTGFPQEAGKGEGEGFTVNFPFLPGSSGKNYLYVFEKLVVPIVSQFKPKFILVSAGYDGHANDPLTALKLSVKDFAVLSERLLSLAEEFCGGKIVFVLEGGYDLKALSYSVLATVAKLARFEGEVKDPYGVRKEDFDIDKEKERVLKLKGIFERYWKL